MEPTIAEIRLFAGNFEPRGWAFCNGQLLSIAEYTALFSLIGTTYGGNGVTTFALPDLRSRIPVGPGQGPGLQNWVLGEVQGTENNTLLVTNLPMHNHQLLCNVLDGSGTENSPVGHYPGVGPINRSTSAPVNTRYSSTMNATMNPQSLSTSGQNQPINNIQPVLALNYIIALEGIFPSRN